LPSRPDFLFDNREKNSLSLKKDWFLQENIMELESLGQLLQNSSHGVSVFAHTQGETPREKMFQDFAKALISVGLTKGFPPEDYLSPEGPFLAFSAEGRPPRHFYQALPSEKEWQPFYRLIRTLANGDIDCSPETVSITRNLMDPVTIRILITPKCPFCAQVVHLANQLTAAGSSLKTWIIDVQLFPEWIFKFPIKSAPAVIMAEEVVKTGVISERELVALVEKRNSREYLRELYRSDLMEKRMGQSMDRLRSRPQDIPLVTGLIKAEEFGVKLGAMALIEQLSEEAPEDQTRIFDALIPLLQEKSVPTLGDAVYLLSALQDPRKRSILKKFLDHSHPDIREIAQEGLNQSQGPEAGEE
jgi:hypothetical protein